MSPSGLPLLRPATARKGAPRVDDRLRAEGLGLATAHVTGGSRPFEPTLEDNASLGHGAIPQMLKDTGEEAVVGQYSVAERIAALGAERDGVPRARPITWTCEAPGFANRRFVGRPIGDYPMALGPLALVPLEFLPIDRREFERRYRLLSAWLDNELEMTWFDGVDVQVLQALLRDQEPPVLDGDFLAPPGHGAASALPDGSLLAPMSLMKPGERVEL